MQVSEYQKADLSMEMRTRSMDTYSYEKDSVQVKREVYGGGFEVYIYSSDGLLESQLISEGAEHIVRDRS